MKFGIPFLLHIARIALVAALAWAAAARGADPSPPTANPDASSEPAKAAAAPAPPKIAAATMLRAGTLVYDRDVQRARAANSIDDQSATARRIQRISMRLLLQAARVDPNGLWVFGVTVENEALPVAYCLPGGKIIASTALIDRMRLADDELAVVLAHAIAHAIAGHDSGEATLRLARTPDGISADPSRTVLNLAEVLAQLVHNEPHTVDAERVADSISLDLLLRAGIDPHVATETWRKVARAGGAVPPGFLALNPMWPMRVDELDASIPAAIKAYQPPVVRPTPPAAPKRK
jgi:predicted Zn-dependent protease